MKWLQVLLFNTNNSIQHYSFVCTQLKGSKYCYVSLAIQLNINYLFTHTVKWSNSVILNNLIKQKSFLCTQFKCQTARKEYSALSKSSSIAEASPSDCLVSYPVHWVGLTPLQRCSWCIPQLKSTGLIYGWCNSNFREKLHTPLTIEVMTV